MPKKLTKLLKLSGKKKGDGDNASIASKASIQAPSELSAIQIFSYTIKKDKDLPKLHKASWQGNVIKVKELAKSSSKPGTINEQDKKNRTPLHLACAQGDANIATHLLSCKAKVNLRDLDGRTPLMKAVDSNQCNCAKVLLDANSDANIADNDGLTPLHVAAHRGIKDIATLLLERDARLNAIDKSGSSPLHYATLQGHNDFVSFLINEGANVNATDGKGHTPLMLAAAEGRIGILKILLQGRPNTELKDDNGCTATDHATINNNNNIVQLIKDYQISTVQISKPLGRPNSMLIEDPKLMLSGSNFRGPAVDDTDDLNDTKTDDTSAKIDVASHNSWNSNDEEDSSQALPASNRGPNLSGALKLANCQDRNPMQATKGHSSVSRQSTVSSKGNPLISRPILHSTSKPLTTSTHSYQQRQQTLPTGRKGSEQSVEDYQLDSFDDSDSESDVEEKPMAKVVNSTPNVLDKKLPGLSFSFDKPPFSAQVTTAEEKEEPQPPDSKVSAIPVPSYNQVPMMADNPTPKQTEALATEKVNAEKGDISSNFDSSPPLSEAEDDQLNEQFGSDSDDDIPTAYVPSVGSGLTRQSHRNPLTGPPQQSTTKEKEKEEDKILELAHSSFLEMDDTSKNNKASKASKNSDTVDSVDTGSPSRNLETFSPITPLTDQVDGASMFPTDAKPTNKKAMKSSDHAVGVMSSLSDSSSSLNTDSVIRQAEEIEQNVENRNHEVQGKISLKSAATIGHEKTERQETEGSDWDCDGVDDEDADTTSKSDSKDEGHNALAGLGTYGLPDLSDPFATHSKHGSKSPSKPGDYFNMYRSDSSESDDDIEKLLSPEKNVEKHNKSPTSNPQMKTDTQAIQDDCIVVNTNTAGNSTKVERHFPPTSNDIRKHNDFVDKGDEMEFVNPFLDDKDDGNDHATTEESESEWEKELKLKRDRKAADQSSLVTRNQQTIPAVEQKQAPSVDVEQLCPTDNNKALTNDPGGKKHVLLANNKATRSLNDNANIHQSKIGNGYPSPLSTKEAASPLPISPSTMKDMQASERYRQKENELLLALEGRRKQLENTKTSVNPPVKNSTRIDEELAHVKRPSIEELRNTWEGQQQVSSDMSPLLHSKSTNKVKLEPMKSSPRSSSEIDNSHQPLNKKNDVANVVVTSSEDHALFEQSMPAKTSESSEILFSEEEEEEEEETDSLSENVNKPSAMADKLAVKSLGLEKLTGTNEQKQQYLLSSLEHSEQSFVSGKSVEEQSRSPTLAGTEEIAQDRQLQQETGEVVEGQEDEQHISNPSSDVLASCLSDQRTTPTDEGMTDHDGAHKHPTDNSDDVILNRSISLSSQHTTTDLSTTHNTVSPIPFLTSSLPRSSALTGYGRPTSSLLESSGVSALQENLRKVQRELERAQTAEAHAKTGKKRMEAQLKRKQSDFTTVKTQLEESKLDLEIANRSMKCQLEQESMARKSAESLVDQFRQQLSKLEQQLRKEKESHQKTLSQRKEAELDHRTLLISTQQLQERLDDMQSRLQRERDSWKLQETLYNERLKVFQDIQEESSKNKERQAQVLTQLEESDVMRQSLLEKHSTLQQQLAQVQVQLSREQQQHEELQLQLSAELEAANSKLTTKSNSLVEADKALLQLQQQFDDSLTELKSKTEVLSAKLDEEVCSKEQAEAELSAMRNQYDKVNSELQAALKEKLLLEKEQRIREQESFKQTSLLERDVTSSQERLQEMVEKLQTMEIKLTSSENENKNLQSRLFEQANQISAIQRESDHNQQLLAAMEEKLSRENELRIKLESQLTSANEKSATSQSELVYLRAQLEVANKSITDKDTLNSESQDKFSSILHSLKADHQQARNSLEEKLQALRDQLMVAKEESAESNLERNSLTKEIIHLKQELEKCTLEKKAMERILEQTKEMSTTNKVSQVDLQHQIEVLNSKLMTSENNYITSQKSCEDLQDQLAEQQQQYDQLQEELALTEQECTTVNEEKIELEESVSTLTEHLEKHQDELSKKDGQIVQLSTQLKHFQDVRSGLEQTTTLLRGEIHEFESQLTSMTVERDKALASAAESKGLWETEIKSRSQLGLKLMQLEKSHSDHAVLLDNEKRKARKALEMKKSVDRKMESYQERNALLQEELVSLKNQLKFTKKKVKEIETSESFIKAELNKAQQLLQSETDSLRSQLLKVSTELRTESILRKEADNGVASLKRECERSRSQLSLSKTELREKEKVHRQLEKGNRRLKEELNTLKEEVSKKYTPISELEIYKIQVEDQAKRELQAKLEEINSHLEQQSTVQAALDKLRSDTELQWQSRYEQTTEELKFQLKKALSEVKELRVERDSKDAEARRYKELFEVESQRREKLSSKLEMAKEHTEHASALGSLDHRPHHLLDNSLSKSLPRNLQNFPSSSYSHPTPSVPLKNSTNDLLSSVRQELDKSIAKHLDSVSSTTRPQLKYHCPSQLAPRRDAARVTAIAQNYFV